MAVRAALENLAPGLRVLAGETAHHLARVLRVKKGDSIELFDPVSGLEGTATVMRCQPAHVTVWIGPVCDAAVRAVRPITVLVGLSKGDKLDAIVRDATELGATRVVAVETWRSVVRLDAARAEARRKRWERIAEEAARQCGRVDPPVIAGPVLWIAALAGVPEEAARFCLHDRSTEPLAKGLAEALEQGRPLAFASGPEGGLTDEEIETARVAGFSIVSLGPFVLRAETVAAAVLGAVRVFSETKWR